MEYLIGLAAGIVLTMFLVGIVLLARAGSLSRASWGLTLAGRANIDPAFANKVNELIGRPVTPLPTTVIPPAPTIKTIEKPSGAPLRLLAILQTESRILDFLLRTGPYGDGFGADPDGVSLDALLASPHGIDYGALKPRLPDVLRTPDGMIALAPEILVADVARLHDSLDGRRDHPFVLIGRRHLRSNNSWMHNVTVLVKGKPQCTMHLHPDDAAALGLADGDPAVVRSRVGELTVPVEVTDAIRPGVVSIPHGWGHDMEGVKLGVAQEHAGVNSNLLADETLFDPISGNAVLNGIPVEVSAAR